jgi:glutathione S-transferase
MACPSHIRAACHGYAFYFVYTLLVEQWMDWQATEFNSSCRYSFMGLMRRSTAHRDPDQIAASVANWNRHVGILGRQLARTDNYVAGNHFTLT